MARVSTSAAMLGLAGLFAGAAVAGGVLMCHLARRGRHDPRLMTVGAGSCAVAAALAAMAGVARALRPSPPN